MAKQSRKMQIGVMGSVIDLNYSKKIEEMAEETGYWIAKNGAVLFFGAEKDFDSLSTAACRGAKKAGGFTIGVTYGKGKAIYEKENVDVVIATGLERGGGRELSLVLSCDAIIAINGGSGTLPGKANAFPAKISGGVLEKKGGWGGRLAGGHFGGIKKKKMGSAENPPQRAEKNIWRI